MDNSINRDGSIGVKILNRFKIILDYQGMQICLKPNRKFNEPFHFDMSGVVVAQKGYSRVKENSNIPVKSSGSNMEMYKNIEVYYFKPKYEILEIRTESPGKKIWP
ncbi:hypothetical protein LB467_16870 [Salegentibacter sp. JZCK2]|uniref:hypothetical protein n=1 Tax=Salegentibacter tibetensis TaxID=2873600 RepID=UPI001CCCFCFB|nr:hypothetical protein [Salegentibacter tibetensis]MBZ9731364.1 hypothetical protein [Salegentibacter tibetensis]